MLESHIAVLDIGTSKVTMVVGEYNEQTKEIEILGVGKCKTSGLRKGTVINFEEVIDAISNAREKAEQMSGREIQSVIVGIAGSHIRCIESDGVAPVANPDEITQEDIEKAQEAARALKFNVDQEILQLVPKDYVIDGQPGIKNPLGMSGVRLEVKAHIITGAASSAHNIFKCVNKAGLNVNELVLNPLACCYAVLKAEEKKLGSILIDIGAGTTDLAVYNNSSLSYISSFSMGGEHITKDISKKFRISLSETEKIKIEYGCALKEKCNPEKQFEFNLIGSSVKKTVKATEIAQVIEERLTEIFNFLKEKIEAEKLKESALCGVVLTGGVAEIPGAQELCEKIIGLPTRLGRPLNVKVLNEEIKNPSFATAVGLLIYAYEKDNNIETSEVYLIDRIIHFLKNTFKQVFFNI
jgi:cell division protein FtsA